MNEEGRWRTLTDADEGEDEGKGNNIGEQGVPLSLAKRQRVSTPLTYSITESCREKFSVLELISPVDSYHPGSSPVDFV
jgi:hypothetical protein